MSRRRRYQWIDAIQTSAITLNGAAAPGTVSDQTIIGEAELENIGGGATLMRVVGDIWVRRLAGTAPIVTATLFNLQGYGSAVAPADWQQDEFQRTANLGSWLWMVGSTDGLTVHQSIDLRTKRKLGQGILTVLAVQNHSVAGENVSFVFHLRCLLLLP